MKKIINAAVIFLESAIFFLLFVLERLSGIKAGVNHHVLARKLQWSEKYFTPENINIIFPCIIAVLAGVILVQAAVYIKKKKPPYMSFFKVNNAALVLWACASAFSLKSGSVMELNTSVYIAAASIMIFAVHSCMILFLTLTEK